LGDHNPGAPVGPALPPGPPWGGKFEKEKPGHRPKGEKKVAGTQSPLELTKGQKLGKSSSKEK